MNRIHYYFLVLVTALFMSSCLLFQPSAKKLSRRALTAHKQYDAVIVPGVPFIAPNWDMTMEMRVMWGVHLYKRGSTKKIIMSGSSVYSPYVEAQIMKLYAIEMGVPADDIIVESKAQHSTENVWYGYKLAKSMGYENIALSTDPFQTRMVYRFGKRRLKQLKYLPVLFDTLRTLPRDTLHIKYEGYKVPNFKPITETQSLWYRLMGTMGKHINFKEK
ncbi:MAG: YdcF family protein [Bacteroidota bacterium]